VTDHKIDIHILATKLNRPAIDRRWMARPRLISSLDRSLDKRVTLISAPAGYGKTTLVVQWLDQITATPIWLSLDQYDNEPDRFIRYIIAGVRRHFPEFGIRTESLLASPTLPPPNYLADTLVSDLVALKKPLVIAIDDFHTTASEPVQAVLARMIQYLPDNVHLVIATRVDPPLPLAQWRVRKWLAEIRVADLRFFPEEARAYFGFALAGQLSDDAIERIVTRTEGWVADLQLARLSLADTDDPEALARRFSGNDRMVVEFFMDEVISRQPDEIKHFFTATSMLDRSAHRFAIICWPMRVALGTVAG
jgi:LuxR family maltose regulon positive regulatory protein